MKPQKITPKKGWEIDQEKSDLSTGTIVFKEIAKKLPSSWEELGYISKGYARVGVGIDCITKVIKVDNYLKGYFPTIEDFNSSEALAQLLQLRKAYIGDWVADWNNEGQKKYTIGRNGNKLVKDWFFTDYQELSFPTAELRDLFFDNFQDLLKIYFKID